MKHMSSLATIRRQICLEGHTKKINLLVPSACSLPSHKSRTPYLAYALAPHLHNHSFEGALFVPAKVQEEM